jgi:hypothetical protein
MNLKSILDITEQFWYNKQNVQLNFSKQEIKSKI